MITFLPCFGISLSWIGNTLRRRDYFQLYCHPYKFVFVSVLVHMIKMIDRQRTIQRWLTANLPSTWCFQEISEILPCLYFTQWYKCKMNTESCFKFLGIIPGHIHFLWFWSTDHIILEKKVYSPGSGHHTPWICSDFIDATTVFQKTFCKCHLNTAAVHFIYATFFFLLFPQVSLK